MDELEQLKIAVKEAGAAILSYYGTDAGVTYKDHDKSPVTKADLAAQGVIIKKLSAFGYSFLSEELVDDETRLNSDRVWVIDPLDGTWHFLQNDGEFCVMAALIEDGRPILGAIYVPVADELYYAQKSIGAFVEKGGGASESIQVSKVEDSAEATMLVSQNHLMPEDIAFADRIGLSNRVTCGSAGVKAMRIASGKAELYINTTNKTGEWDSCAADIIVSEAGGKMTDMNGDLLRYNKPSPMNHEGFIVFNGALVGIQNDNR